MNAYIPLELILKNILHVISPSGEDWSTRALVIAELRAVVQSLESFRGATVEPYGSFVSNLFARCADLDISIELTNGAYLVSAGKKHKQNLLREVQKALRRRGGWRKLQFVPNARVPILKFESNSLNISCDVSINNLIGQMKSKLLFWINEIDGRFRDMVLLVKEWAKTHDINDSKSGTLNSYSLCLLIIFHFQILGSLEGNSLKVIIQPLNLYTRERHELSHPTVWSLVKTCAPALLPPLKEIYPGNMVDDLIGVRATAERRIEEICGENIHKFRSEKSRKRNQSSLSELFVSFLAKFSDISSRALEQGICLYTGQWEQIDRNMRWLPKTYALFVEDPFEQPGNTARTVSHRHLITISEAFRETHRMLISGNQNPSSLIGILVRPQVSQFIYRTPSSPNGYSSGHRGNCPPVHRAVHSPSQVQHQFQSQRVDRPPSNATMPRSVNIPRNQAQQAWRPRSDR